MALLDARDVPVDPESVERLAAQNLILRAIPVDDAAGREGFIRAEARGFLEPEPTAEVVAYQQRIVAERRLTGVFPQHAGRGEWPVATVDSWATPMTIPGGEIDMWAISGVTVSGTHRRRGIARALLEGELRSAAAAGIALAGLTASEATLYSRYGFAPALPAARLTVDARRAGWVGGESSGRIEYVERSVLADELGRVHERERRVRSGQIPGWRERWEGMAGLAPDSTKPDAVRGVRYRDAAGTVRGVLAYSLAEMADGDFFELSIHHLGADGAEALRALWGFAIRHDLVAKVSADLRPVDDPLPWLVADPRAVTVSMHDHGWLRILDVPAALGARTFRAPIDIVLQVHDPLGYAQGDWRLTVGADGASFVARDEPGSAVARAALDVGALAALYAGGITAAQLHAAGRIDAAPELIATLDDAFREPEAPSLGIWY